MEIATVAKILVALTVLTSVVAPAGALGSGDQVSAPAEVDPDAVHLAIDVQPDGSAEWRVEYRVRLTDENETTAYEQFVADVENNSSAYVDRFSTRIDNTVADAESQTGRSMQATDYEVSAEIRQLPQTYGVLTYTFTWENFAPTDGTTITVGDTLRGFFLDSETTMLISWPDTYHATTVAPEPSEQRPTAVTWVGPLDFASGEPLIELEAGPPTTDGTTQDQQSGLGLAFLVGGALLVLIGIGFLWWYTNTDRDGDESAPVESAPMPPDDGEPETSETAPPSEPADELLSNEERVERFLHDHGGRAKQQEIVEGLGWTEAKTSQVLSEMHDADAIEKFRIGRENVVKLPDDESAQ